jgi:hypothetical protein
MTNAQWAHKMGLDRIPHRDYEYAQAITEAGLEITKTEKTLKGMSVDIFEGEIETGRGTLHIVLGVNGTARIDKPNETHKWVYEKTPAQITAQLKQIIKFYK